MCVRKSQGKALTFYTARTKAGLGAFHFLTARQCAVLLSAQ